MKISTTTDIMSRVYGDAETIRRLADIGFDGLDYSMFATSIDGELFARDDEGFLEYYRELKRVADGSGIVINQVHSPMPSWTGDEARDAHIWRCQARSVRAAAALGSPYIIIHPCIPPECRYDHYRAESRALNMRFYGGLTPLLKETGVVLCVENMFNHDPVKDCICPTVCSEAEEMNDYIDALGPRFAACLDTGHSVLSGSGAGDMARKLGPRLKTLHVHDNDGLHDSHLPPFLGDENKKTHISCVDWADFAAALREIGYPGMLSLESDSLMVAFGLPLVQDCAVLLYKIARQLVIQYGL